jgi:anhydro-N-acetylmuramic acid kinase
MIVAGVMSGTSADGINVALVRITQRGQECPRHTILAHAEYPFSALVRRTILNMMNAESARVANLARLNFLLGELYAEAVAKTARRQRIKLDLVGCHGQTLYHQGTAAPFLGRKLAVTWQTGEGAVMAARLGVPVVSDFRPADMAVGGKGAPLVPFLDYALYRDSHIGRIAQNIGGIANLTAIPANAKPAQVIAFDSGPGNMLMDAVTEKLFDQPYDRGGRIAASGQVLDGVVSHLAQAAFFRRQPPKTAGREEFGSAYAKEFLRRCGSADNRDVVATATALTAQSIVDSVRRFVPRTRGRYQEMIVSGGGANNAALIAMLRNELAPLGIGLRFSDEFGVPIEAKEAVAFAVLAYETWHRRPSNVPSATGAKRPAILGKISYA